jgi:hypothetical protein
VYCIPKEEEEHKKYQTYDFGNTGPRLVWAQKWAKDATF